MATKAEVDILLNFRSDIQGVFRANTALRTLTGAVGSVRNVLAGLGIGVGVGGLATLAKSSLDLAGRITDLAASARIGTQELQTFFALGAKSGVTWEESTKVLTTLARSIEEAAGGNTALASSFSLLNLNAAGLKALAPERQLELVARSIMQAKDQTAAWNAAMEILGTKNAPKVRAMLAELARDGFDKVSEATKNLRISDADLKTLDEAGDKLDAIWTRMKVIAAQGVVKVAAAVESADVPRQVDPDSAEGKYNAARQAENDVIQARIRRQISEANVAEVGDESIDRAMRAAELNERAIAARQKAEAEKRRQEYVAAETAARELAEKEAADKAFKAQIEENQKSRERWLKLMAENRAEAERNAREEAEAVAKARAVASTEADRALGNATFAIDLQRQRIENDATSTIAQKRAALLPLYAEENALIAKRVELLQLELALEKDPAARQSVQSRIDSLQQRSAANSGQAQAAAPLGLGDQLTSDLTKLQDQFGTVTESISRMLTNTVGSAVQGVSDGIYGMITRTQTWGQVWLTVGASILKSLIDMGVQQAVLFAKGLVFTKANASAQAAAGAQIAASNAPAAAATSISSYGGAAVAGMVAAGIAIGAIIAMLASGGMATGGRVSGPGTGTSDSIPMWLSNDEFVIRAAAAQAIGYENLAYANRTGRLPAGAASPTGGVSPASSGGSSAPANYHYFDMDKLLQDRIARGDFDSRIRYVNQRDFRG